MGRRAVLLAAVAAALVLPAPALAATGRLDNGNMIYTAGAGESNTVVFTVGGDQFSPTFLVQDQPSVEITPTPPCFNRDTNQLNVMECPQDGGGTGQVVLFSASLGDGNDSIQLVANLPTSIGAGGGQDVMTGGPAADFLRGGQGGDTIEGAAGNDQLVGDDPNVQTGGDDSLNGGAGNDSVDGQAGNDTVRGADGNDTLNGSDGDDVFPAEGQADGVDVVSGGPGVDTASYDARSTGQQLSLDDVANDGFIGNANDNILSDVENLVGTAAGDSLTGSGAANRLDGGGGADTLAGLGGDDLLNAAAGDDSATGGDGNDTIEAGDGNDSGAGGEGADRLAGGGGNDALSGDAGPDALLGDSGADALNGGDGDDDLQGGPDDDALDGAGGADAMAGGGGVDLASFAARTEPLTLTLDGAANDGAAGERDNVQTDVENLDGGSGADTLVGSAADNRLSGGSGEDYADGGAGADRLVGGEAGDVLRTRGGSAGATIECGPGPDFVVGKQADTGTPDCERIDRGVNQRPRLRDSALVAPAGGTLQMSPAGIVRRVPLQDTVVLPLGSVVDSVAGTVRVTSAASVRKRQTMALEDGVFNVTQSAGRLPVTQFALLGGDFSACPAPASRSAARAAQKAKTIRVLWAKGKGKFRTKGRYAAATVRGTRWQTADRCDGTLIRVTQGSVTVRDLVRKRNVVVRAGKSYFASASRAARR